MFDVSEESVRVSVDGADLSPDEDGLFSVTGCFVTVHGEPEALTDSSDAELRPRSWVGPDQRVQRVLADVQAELDARAAARKKIQELTGLGERDMDDICTQDLWYRQIRTYLTQRSYPADKQTENQKRAFRSSASTFSVEDGDLFRLAHGAIPKRRVPLLSELADIMVHLHAAPGAATHAGRDQLEASFNGVHEFQGLRAAWTGIPRTCNTCVMYRKKHVEPQLQPIVSSLPMERLVMDLTEMKAVDPVSQNRYLLVLLDKFTRFIWVKPLATKEAGPIATFLRDTFASEGYPQILQSDNGSEFRNKLVEAVLEKGGTTFINGSPYHPQSQGVVERCNRTLKEKLWKLIASAQDTSGEWEKYLSTVVESMNNSRSKATGAIPFEALRQRRNPSFLLRRPGEKAHLKPFTPEEVAQMYQDMRAQQEKTSCVVGVQTSSWWRVKDIDLLPDEPGEGSGSDSCSGDASEGEKESSSVLDLTGVHAATDYLAKHTTATGQTYVLVQWAELGAKPSWEPMENVLGLSAGDLAKLPERRMTAKKGVSAGKGISAAKDGSSSANTGTKRPRSPETYRKEYRPRKRQARVPAIGPVDRRFLTWSFDNNNCWQISVLECLRRCFEAEPLAWPGPQSDDIYSLLYDVLSAWSSPAELADLDRRVQDARAVWTQKLSVVMGGRGAGTSYANAEDFARGLFAELGSGFGVRVVARALVAVEESERLECGGLEPACDACVDYPTVVSRHVGSTAYGGYRSSWEEENGRRFSAINGPFGRLIQQVRNPFRRYKTCPLEEENCCPCVPTSVLAVSAVPPLLMIFVSGLFEDSDTPPEFERVIGVGASVTRYELTAIVYFTPSHYWAQVRVDEEWYQTDPLHDGNALQRQPDGGFLVDKGHYALAKMDILFYVRK